VQEKYFRKVQGVDRKMPGYVVREECKRNSAVKFEDKMDGKEECRILTEC
jgi:hypothetical protein